MDHALSADSIYRYNDYRAYLTAIFPTAGSGRGKRAQLARYLKCQPAFLSQVLAGKAQLSKDMAFATCKFLGLAPVATEFFLLLLDYSRAGSKELSNFLRKQIEARQNSSKAVSERLALDDSINDDILASTYYSSWIYSAVHIAAALKEVELTSEEALAQRFHVTRATIAAVKRFLAASGLIMIEGEYMRISSRRIHIKPSSPWISRHHVNWRLKTINNLELAHDDDLHYSSVLALSLEDAEQLRELTLELLAKKEKILRDSPEDRLFAFNVDLFELTGK